jgi:membrane-associated protease RseP (regulator of RpoE activity)
MVINFIVTVPLSLGAPVGGLSPLLRTPLPPSDTTSRTSFEDFLGTPGVSDPTAGDDKIVGLHGANVTQQVFLLGSDKWVEPRAAECQSVERVEGVRRGRPEPSRPAE